MGLRHYPIGKRIDGNTMDILHDMSTQLLRLSQSGINTDAKGGGGTIGDTLRIYPNNINTYPVMKFRGGGEISVDLLAGQGFRFDRLGVQIGYFEPNITELTFGTYINRDIAFTPNGTGKLKFGTYTGGAASDSIGSIAILDAAGTARKLMVQA